MLCNSYILHKTKWTGRAHTHPPLHSRALKSKSRWHWAGLLLLPLL